MMVEEETRESDTEEAAGDVPPGSSNYPKPAGDGEHRCEACGRDAESPHQIPLAGWRDIGWRVKEELAHDNTTVVAAGVAFFGLLAFVPLVGVLVALYGLLADPHDVARHLSDFSVVLPAAGGRLVRTVLEDVADDPTGQLSLSAVAGLAATLWGASRGMRSLLRALSIAYDEDGQLSWVRERALSVGYTVAAIALVALLIGVIVALPTVLSVMGLPARSATLLRWLRWPALALLSVGAISALYRWGPARRPARWPWLVGGAVLATALWMLGSSLLSTYFHRIAHVNESYGPIGAVFALMLWFFMVSYAVLLGAQLNAEMERQTTIDTTVGPPRPMGERGAYVADHLGPCRPPLRHVLAKGVRKARRVASDLRDRARRKT